MDDWIVGSKACWGGGGGSAVVGSNFRTAFGRPINAFYDLGLGTANCTSAGTYYYMLGDENTRQNLYYYSLDWNGIKPDHTYTYTNGLGFGTDIAGNAWNIWSSNGSHIWDWHQDYVGGYLHYRFKINNYSGYYCSGSCRYHNVWSKDPTEGFELSDVVHDSGVFPESNQNDHTYQVDIQWNASGYHASIFDVTANLAYSEEDFTHTVTIATHDSWTWGYSLWSGGYPDEEATDHASHWRSAIFGDAVTGTSGGGDDVRTDSLPVIQPLNTTGAISVTTNLPAATFNITGPTNYSGSGMSFSQSGAPAGKYTITFDAVTGYLTPPPETKGLPAGGLISYVGKYVLSAEPGQVLLTVRKNGSGSGSVRSNTDGIDCGTTCAATIKVGSHVKLEAVAAAGSTFVGWSDSFCKGTLQPCSFTISGSQTVTATFISTPANSSNKIIYVGVCGAGYWFDDTCFSGAGWYDPRDEITWVDPFNDSQLDSESIKGDLSGLDAIGLRIGKLFPTSVTLVTGFSIANVVSETVLLNLIKNNVAGIVDFIVGVYKPGDRIYLVGHSAGASIVREVATNLLAKKIPVAMTGQIDIVDQDAKVPENVARAFNFYYPTPLADLCLVSGLSEIVPAKKQSLTIVSNARIDAPLGPDALIFPPCGGHRNMDNDPLVWRPILNFMVGIP